jgi:DNA invertase Pin-like site-specific DNA recombinase
VVTKLDRLARSVADLLVIVARIEVKQATLRVLDLNLDTTMLTGKLMLNLLGSIAQLEREPMLERQREGIAAVKAAGKYKGRKPMMRSKAPEVHALKAQGVGGDFIAEAAIEIHGAGQARATASRMIAEGRGAVAFSRTGDPATNEWQGAVILGRYGEVRDDLAPYTSV